VLVLEVIVSPFAVRRSGFGVWGSKFGVRRSGFCLLTPHQSFSRPYSRSEVIHRAGDESLFPAFERERPRIVNNFAASASSGYEFSSISEKMNSTRLSNLAVVLGSGNEYSDEDESSLETITSGYKEFASGSGRANDRYPPSPEYERICLRATA
jgi:hypothetical protein